jgi:hypothetical protein
MSMRSFASHLPWPKARPAHKTIRALTLSGSALSSPGRQTLVEAGSSTMQAVCTGGKLQMGNRYIVVKPGRRRPSKKPNVSTIKA